MGPMLGGNRRGRRSPMAEINVTRIFLRADRALDYGSVMKVMGEISAAGLRRVAMVSTQEGEPG